MTISMLRSGKNGARCAQESTTRRSAGRVSIRPIVGMTTIRRSGAGGTGPVGARRSRNRVRSAPKIPSAIPSVGSDHRNVVAQPVIPVGPRVGHSTSEQNIATANITGSVRRPGRTTSSADRALATTTAGAARVTSLPASPMRSVTARRGCYPRIG